MTTDKMYNLTTNKIYNLKGLSYTFEEADKEAYFSKLSETVEKTKLAMENFASAAPVNWVTNPVLPALDYYNFDQNDFATAKTEAVYWTQKLVAFENELKYMSDYERCNPETVEKHSELLKKRKAVVTHFQSFLHDGGVTASYKKEVW